MTTEPRQFLRYIKIDDDNLNLIVGYDYPKKQFYVTNKDTTTFRASIEDIYSILEIFNVEVTDTLKEDIQACKDQEETLGTTNSLYYKWNKEGTYIYYMQFNEWDKYPILLEAEKSILRIDNSEIVVDLTTSESIQFVVAPRLCSFYKETLGLYIDIDQMTSICNFLLYFYNPTCINLIQQTDEDTTTTKELRYSNQFKLTNYNNTAIAEYTCTNNPLNTPTYTSIGNIVELTDSSNIVVSDIHLVEDKYTIEEGIKLQISNIPTQVVEGEEYSANGTYTVQSIQGNTITVEETFPISYSYPYYNCYAVEASYNITSILRDTSSIEVSEAPNSIVAGDKIIVVGAVIEGEYENINLDKEYTVQSIQGNTITVEEEILTNFSGTGAKVYKNKYISSIESVDTETRETVTFLNTTEYNLETKGIMVYNSSIQNIENKVYTVQSMLGEEGNYTGIELAEPLSSSIELKEYPQLQYPVPSTDILVEVTKVRDEYKDVFPVGKFILNTYNEANSYIGLCPNLIKPSDMLKTYDENKNLYSRNIEENMYSIVQKGVTIPIVILGEWNYDMEGTLIE